MGAALFVSGTAWAQPFEKERVVRQQTTVREIQGEVGGITKRYISIIYRRDVEAGTEEELLLPIDQKTTKLEHIKSLSDLAQGDIVRVRFNDEYRKTNRGKESDTLTAVVISFVKKGTPLPAPAQDVQGPSGGALRSD
jgi:hypothetical protein